MSDHKRQHKGDQNQTTDASKTAGKQANREAGALHKRDQSRELAQLLDKVDERKQRTLDFHAKEKQTLKEQHDRQRQELAKVQADERPQAAATREIDRKTEKETLNRFQETQREQLTQRQQLEQSVLQKQAKAVADLQARQQDEISKLQQGANLASPRADRTLDNDRQQLETRQQQEREQLDKQIQVQLQALQDYREQLQVQMDKDQGRMQNALYEERPNAEHQEALKEVLANQELENEKLENNIKAQLTQLDQLRSIQSLNEPQNVQEGSEKEAINTLDRTTRYSPDPIKETSKTEQQEAGREVDARQIRDQSRELAQMRDKIDEKQQHAVKFYAEEIDAQKKQHNNHGQDLTKKHADEADATREMDRDAEKETLHRFQETQREQLAQRQQLEQSVFQEQAKAVADLQARQQQEISELQQRPEAGRALDNDRQQLEARQQQEREQLDGHIRAQLQALQDHREQLQTQMQQDQKGLERTLAEKSQGVEHQEALREVLAKQQLENMKLENEVKTQLTRLNHAKEEQALNEKHTRQQQKLERNHADKRPEANVGREADRKAEKETLNRFQETQREQLAQRQQLEQIVFQEQAKAVADLQARQQQAMSELQQQANQASPKAERTLNKQRRQLEASQQQKREQLDSYFRAQLQTLKDHRDHVQAQINRDQWTLQQVLYEERRGPEHQVALNEVLTKQEVARRELDQVVKRELGELEQQYQRLNDPANKMAQFSDTKVYSQQRRAIRSDEGVRLSEHEHIRARINLVLQTLEPETQESPINQITYRNMVTLTIPRDMAVEKTKLDMELRDKLRESLKTGVVSEELIRDMDIQADIERTIQARDKIIADRLAAGRAVDDLKTITDTRIIEAAHLQQSELFDVGNELTSLLLREVKDEEISQYIEEEFKRFIS
ncbi:hypothetical protein EDS67_00695 [candidate division KSB1 bacterium]|nr:MAG: hypothetical protein EDS67_00695 [candidate division KSB1 bacterium]MBC6946625.1 hypothetical protein [candidate division KSB1 bacterium]MCE7940110.1 hypothetical protein [Chlorobi bacterium CHB1]MDL1873592.1 hypothetical protein [Cytophagia bacterium CHB2]